MIFSSAPFRFVSFLHDFIFKCQKLQNRIFQLCFVPFFSFRESWKIVGQVRFFFLSRRSKVIFFCSVQINYSFFSVRYWIDSVLNNHHKFKRKGSSQWFETVILASIANKKQKRQFSRRKKKHHSKNHVIIFHRFYVCKMWMWVQMKCPRKINYQLSRFFQLNFSAAQYVLWLFWLFVCVLNKIGETLSFLIEPKMASNHLKRKNNGKTLKREKNQHDLIVASILVADTLEHTKKTRL